MAKRRRYSSSFKVCGIVGVYSPKPVERERLQRALQAMERRGPDGAGEWWSEDGCVGLGHRRLAINDEMGGAQPLVAEDTVATINGEFYDLPPHFVSGTDSLCLPHFYKSCGAQKMFSKLRGEFAFLLYDCERRSLLVGRDRFGIKPLFWGRRQDEVWFASKASALWAAGLEAGWCETSFVQAATTQYPPLGGSLFRGIRSVKPGHYFQFQDGEMAEHKYWEVPSGESSDFQDVLSESVKIRVRPNGSTAVLLSGGVDSAATLALAAKATSNLRAYTIDFPASGSFSEGALARKQCEQLGIPHRLIELMPEAILRDLGAAVRDTEGLAVNGHLVGKWRLAKAVHEDGCKVLLSGEGADELLCGYRHFRPYFGGRTTTEDKAGLGILVTDRGLSPLPLELPHFFHSKYHLGQKILSFFELPNEPIEQFSALCSKSGLEAARRCWLETALRSYILEVLGDGAEMSHSVEGRPPFLDHHLWLTVDPTQMCGNKELLRSSVKGLIIDEIRQKPKHPFMAPALGDGLIEALRTAVVSRDHQFVSKSKALDRLSAIECLPDEERLEWEPAMLWVLSSYYLQERFHQ